MKTYHTMEAEEKIRKSCGSSNMGKISLKIPCNQTFANTIRGTRLGCRMKNFCPFTGQRNTTLTLFCCSLGCKIQQPHHSISTSSRFVTTACPRSTLAKEKGYILKTKLFLPLFGKSKMHLRTI